MVSSALLLRSLCAWLLLAGAAGAQTRTSDNAAAQLRTARQMADNIDLDVSGIMSETETLDASADRLFDEVLAVASGKETAAERLGHREFAIHRRNPTI